MGHILTSVIDRQRADDIAATSAAMGEAPVLREFVLSFRRGREVIRTQTVYGVDSCSVAAQHKCLEQEGEVLEVMPRRRGFFTDAELTAGDAINEVDKAQRRVARDVRVGVEQQAQMWRENGVL